MNSSLRVGYAKQEITPPQSCSLVGYTQRIDLHGPGNSGVLDPLFVRALYFQSGAETLLWLLFDLCILENPCAQGLRCSIAKATGIDEAHILLSASHTHSGPYPWQTDWASGAREFVPAALCAQPSIDYWAQLKSTAVQAALSACAEPLPATLRTRGGQLGFAYNRRVHQDREVQMCWNPKESPHLHPDPADDSALVLLEIHRPHDRILFFNTAGHPVTLGKYSNHVSADWPGAVCRQLEANDSRTHACFVHGAGADAHPWLATDSEPSDLDRVAAPVSGLVQLLAASGGHSSNQTLLATASCPLDLSHAAITLTAWRIGPVCVLAFPGELFGISGLQLRRASPAPLLLATTSNGWTGYWPPSEIFAQGGYELDAVQSFGLRRGDTKQMLKAATALLHSLPTAPHD